MLTKKKYKYFYYIINIKNKILGRISSFISNILTGKNKKIKNKLLFDKLFLININEINLLNRKKKIYYKYSGYPGGLYKKSFKLLYNKNPKKIFYLSIKNMIKNNKIRKILTNKLKFNKNITYIKNTQKPKILNIF